MQRTPTVAVVTPRLGRSVAVLGGGFAGLAAARVLAAAGHRVDVYEKDPHVGGHASTHRVGRFLFDEGPHVSFTRRPEIQALFAAAVGGRYLEHEARVLNFWHGHQMPHPAQCHLYGLPVALVERCLVDLIEGQRRDGPAPSDYGDWCRRSLGNTFSEEFTFRYTRKYWTTEADNLSTDWVGTRVYSPRLDEVLRGALSHQKPTSHYITQFRYPECGGFGSYVRAVLPDGARVHPGRAVARIDLARGRLEFADGSEAFHEHLVSSLPLPELIRRIKDVPAEVAEAADRLVCTSIVLINVGVERDHGFPDAHWAYIYDEDVPASRIHFPHRLSPHCAPPGCGSVQAEIYYSPYRPVPTGNLLDRTIGDLTRLGILRRDDRILVARQQVIPYGNVVFDRDRAAALAVVQGWLRQQEVQCCGRYGEWAYYWTDDSILSGWRAAEAVASALARPG